MNNENAESIDNNIYFISSGETITPGSVELHNKSTKEITRTLDEVKSDWKQMSEKISAIIAETDIKFEKDSGFKLSEIEIGLAFNAKGKIAFVAEAGAEASIKFLLKR